MTHIRDDGVMLSIMRIASYTVFFTMTALR